ncbi:MAG: ABC transporter permease subunit [Thermoplasmata archaeon]|nr:ABC transporter permease subunit [Thermoplasmata archaeon]MCI4356330.1 ABC transporter permease subunit [Thermoplasmata archaeon]
MSAGSHAVATPTIEELDAEVERWVRPGQGWRLFLRRFLGNPALITGVGVLGAYVAIAIAAVVYYGPTLTTPPFRVDWAETIPPPGPSWAHPFGIMSGIGVDGFGEVARAFPIDLGLVFLALGSAGSVGVLLGAYAAVRGGAADFWVSFAADVEAGMPPFFFVIVLYLGLELTIPPAWRLYAFPLLFGAVLWPYYARPVRAVAKQVVTEPYVESARAAGATRAHVLFRHVLPNALYPALAQVPVDVYSIFFVFTIFPFLNCSSGGLYNLITPFPNLFFPEWGSLLAQGTCYGFSIFAPPGYWWMYFFPAAAIIGLGFGLTFTCDGIDRWLSTRRRA